MAVDSRLACAAAAAAAVATKPYCIICGRLVLVDVGRYEVRFSQARILCQLQIIRLLHRAAHAIVYVPFFLVVIPLRRLHTRRSSTLQDCTSSSTSSSSSSSY
jgi:hypothetical protein